MTGDAARVAEYWSRNLAGSDPFSPLVYWLAVPEVHARYQRRACGDRPYSDWVELCVREHLRPGPTARILSLGCGAGLLERRLHQLGAFAQCDAYDLAPGAIEAARAEAAAAGIPSIRYEVRDLELTPLEVDLYDAAWFNGSLHHIGELETVCARVRAALKPSGWLFFNEYVGANRFAFGERQRQCIESAFFLIPADLRRSFAPEQSGRIQEAPPIPDPAAVALADPSEAVRSADILGVVGREFRIVTQNRCGGSILQFLLSGIAGNFNSNDHRSMAILEMLFAVEDALVDSGELASDFVVVAAQRD